MKLSFTINVIISIVLFGTLEATAEPSVSIPLIRTNNQLLFAAPEGYQLADYSFGAVPSQETEANPHGMSVLLSKGRALTVYGPVVNTGPGFCLIECELYATGPNFALAAAALNVPSGTQLSDIDGSIATNQLVSGSGYVGAWKIIEVVYDPQGDSLAPVLQVVGTSNIPVTVHAYQMRITPLRKLPVDEAIEILRLTEPSPVPTPTPTLPAIATSTPVPGSEVISVSLTIRAFIENVSDLHIKGNQLWYNHINGTPPGNTYSDRVKYPTYINGEPWCPEWTGNQSNRYKIPQIFIPSERGFYYWFEPIRARGFLDLKQFPNVSNDYELILQFDDQGQSDMDWYELTLVRSNVPPVSVESNQLYWSGKVLSYFGVLRLDIQGETVTEYKEDRVQSGARNAVFGSPLPDYPVNVSVHVLTGKVSVEITQQPRAWNNYTAQFVVRSQGTNRHTPENCEFLFSWSGEVPPEATATPWPTMNPAQPSPTPLSGTAKVLWIVRDRAFPDEPNPYLNDDFMDFRDLFSQCGAESDWILAGSQPVTSELLSGYIAVIFGDIQDISPLIDEETLAVLEFVRGGGSIFVMGKQRSSSVLETQSLYATSITRPFGIEFSTYTPGGVTLLESHPLLYHVSNLSGSGSKLLVKAPARALVTMNNGEVILAIAEEGYGRVVAYSDESVFFSKGSSFGGLNFSSNQRFAQNIAAWLLHQENRVSATPTPLPGVIVTPIPTESAIGGSLTIRAFIDGYDRLHIKGNQIWFEHFTSSLPGHYGGANYPTTINGIEWYPSWSGSRSNSLEWPHTILPETSGFYYRLDSLQIRESIGFYQYPNAANNYELIIFFDDEYPRGAAWYEVTLYWSNVPPYPLMPNQCYWFGAIKTNGPSVRLDLQSERITTFSNQWNENKIVTLTYVYSNPLPAYPVDITVRHLSGTIKATVLAQPRATNNFTAQIALENTEVNNYHLMYGELLISWGDEVRPDPTSTPWPTWNAAAPTPTPLADKPRVLWIVREFFSSSESYSDFYKIFSQMGAVNTYLRAGNTKITPEMLSRYNTLIFGDTRDVAPLTLDEQAAVLDYVRSGGSILIIGQQDDLFLPEPSAIYASSVGIPFGIQFSTSITGSYWTFASHPILTGVYLLSGVGGSKLIVTPPAQTIGWDKPGGTPILAVAEEGYGRVVAYSDEQLFFGKDYYSGGLSQYSHLQFATNIAAWLLRLEDQYIPTPTSTRVPIPTSTPTLTPTFDPNASPTPTPQAINLLERYPTDLEEGDTNPGRAREWTFGSEDMYRLTQFRFTVGNQMDIDVGKADLGIGKSEDGAVWAIVMPREGGTLTSSAATGSEPIAHIWLRLHPKDILTLFPVGTVWPNGNTVLIPEMRRIADIKIRSSWHSGGRAMIPPPGNYTVDCDLTTLKRRFFVVDLNAGTAEYISAFENRWIQPPEPISGGLAETIFDQVWNEYDRQYAMFVIRPEVDWAALREEYQPRALEATTQYDLAYILAEMLAPLRDLHIWIQVGSGYVPVFNRPYVLNVNANAYTAILGEVHDAGNNVKWAIAENDIGFLAIHTWSDMAVPSQVDSALEHLKNTKALIVDVRNNSGGGEGLAQQVAGRFADQYYIGST